MEHERRYSPAKNAWKERDLPDDPDSRMMIRNCQFAFKCDAVWESLEEQQDPKIRFCHSCSKSAYLCDDDAELHDNVVQNRCMAIFRMDEIPLGLIELVVKDE